MPEYRDQGDQRLDYIASIGDNRARNEEPGFRVVVPESPQRDSVLPVTDNRLFGLVMRRVFGIVSAKPCVRAETFRGYSAGLSEKVHSINASILLPMLPSLVETASNIQASEESLEGNTVPSERDGAAAALPAAPASIQLSEPHKSFGKSKVNQQS